MSGNIRLPNITGKTVEEQAQQMKSYLTQLAGELNWALDNMNGVTGGSSGYIPYRSANTGGAGSDVQKKTEELLQNFNDLKGLIIKSADIVNAYYEEINTKLKGLYVAQSEYGTFVELTTANFSASSAGITQSYINTQLLTTELQTSNAKLQENIDGVQNGLNGSIGDAKKTLEGKIAETKGALEKQVADAEGRLQESLKNVNTYLVDVSAHIKSGEIDRVNGIPIYGVEVGQTVNINGEEKFNKFARFTSSRLSFYDNSGSDEPVAYIGHEKLFITNAEITGSFTHGSFVDTVMEDKSIVTKWIGGG